MQIIRRDVLASILGNLRTPAIISLLLVLPFVILELKNRRSYNEGFPVPLFGLMWLLPLLFMLTLMPIVRNLRAENGSAVKLRSLLPRVVFLCLVAWLWTSLLLDQLPCFLGVPNCD